MATHFVTVTPAEVAAAQALISISGGTDGIDPVIVGIAEAKPRPHSEAHSTATE